MSAGRKSSLAFAPKIHRIIQYSTIEMLEIQGVLGYNGMNEYKTKGVKKSWDLLT